MHSRPPSALIRAHKSDWSTFIGGIELWRLSTSSSKLKWIHGHPEAEPETINSRIGFPSFHLRVLPNLTPDRPGARLAYLTFLIQPFRVHSRRASKRTESGREKSKLGPCMGSRRQPKSKSGKQADWNRIHTNWRHKRRNTSPISI
jgi:hypothetical protein